MSEEAWDRFWLVFWGVVATALGAGVAILVNGIWWVGALIGLAIYLVTLLLIFTGGDGGSGIFIFDLD